MLQGLQQGATLVVDEIDTSLHPELVARLVLMFQDDRMNPREAQLLFTTHDATLLGTAFGEEVLARDQVWFVEKDDSGASRIYPLSDFHPRKEGNRERRYLAGSYGAVPMLSDRKFAAAVHPQTAEGIDGRAS
jgi:AAA15 family ATPase/GTPase